jgi:hypothetical protein
LNQYLGSIIKPGYYLSGRKGVIEVDRPQDWPAVSVALFHDPVKNATGYSAQYTEDKNSFTIWLRGMHAQMGIPTSRRVTS